MLALLLHSYVVFACSNSDMCMWLCLFTHEVTSCTSSCSADNGDSVCSSSWPNFVCIICKTEKKEPDLKLFGPDRWETAKNAAAWRLTLQNDHFFGISEEI